MDSSLETVVVILFQNMIFFAQIYIWARFWYILTFLSFYCPDLISDIFPLDNKSQSVSAVLA